MGLDEAKEDILKARADPLDPAQAKTFFLEEPGDFFLSLKFIFHMNMESSPKYGCGLYPILGLEERQSLIGLVAFHFENRMAHEGLFELKRAPPSNETAVVDELDAMAMLGFF